MGKIDPGLKFLAEQKKPAIRAFADELVFAVEAATGEEPTANVLLEFDDDLAAVEEVGFETQSVTGDVASGTIQLRSLAQLEELEVVRRVEVSRALYAELDLAMPETRANAVHTGPPGHRGAGVIVGIIDSGIDYTHQAFRRTDGTSRILAIWDQALAPQGSEAAPAGFSYGVEYRKAEIDNALVAANPFTVVRHQDAQIPADGFHGTHVVGIAAGDGSVAGAGQPALTFVGVAPEADIVVVANTRGRASGERGLGDSADTFDAVRYIFDIAASLGRPAVINQSQGDNVGPHDGTSLLERGIDNLLGGQGRAMVKSAGNEGAMNRHASGTVPAGGTQAPQFTVPAAWTFPVMLDIWYDGADRIDFSITPPGGAASAVVSPGNTNTIALPGGNQVFVDSDINDPGNQDNRIFVIITSGGASAIQPGTWSVTLAGTTVTAGQWDAWIQRGPPPHAQFIGPLANPARTISVPGTSQEIITAASYVTRGAGVGTISTFSSLGPTRDGRRAPTLAAPGQVIMAPQPISTGDTYGLMQGTSMASPMITGAVALMLQRDPTLTQAQIRECLRSTARSDLFTGTTPNNAWGAGKLDANAAFSCAVPPAITIQPPCGPVTLLPPCSPITRRPPCRPITLEPPCAPITLRPPCGPRTTRPPCPPQTFGPPCPRPPTLGPPCPPKTLGPPCPRPRTFRPPCPTQSLTPPCPGPLTVGPPCPLPTQAPPCIQPTLAPVCAQPTLGPACGLGPAVGGGVAPGTPGLDYTSGGWTADAGWIDWYAPSEYEWYDPYGGESWYEPAWLYDYEAQSTDPWGYPSAQWTSPEAPAKEAPMSREPAPRSGFGANDVTFWHGNTAY